MRIFVLILFISLSSCGGGGGNPTSPPDPPNPTFSWEKVSPESVGLSAEKVTAAMNYAMEDGKYSQAAIIIKNGKIVAEEYRGIKSNEVTQLVSNLFPSFGPINLESLLS